MSKHISILGGGPAGLAAGYFAQKKELDFTLYEAQSKVGGNCQTITETIDGQIFRYDTGAHRLHDKSPIITQLIKDLLGDDLRLVQAPSQIYHQGQFVDFPLSPYNLWQHLGSATFLKASLEILKNKLKTNSISNFKQLALQQYGNTIAGEFLLPYTEKLWGLPTENLSTQITGNRLKGLDLKTFLLEQFQGKNQKIRHLDGAFYYPKYGYGTIAQTLANTIPTDQLKTKHRIQGIFHQNKTITHLQINNQKLAVEEVFLTLPLPLTLRLLQPQAPAHLLKLAQNIRFRHILLIVLHINRPSLSNNATIYFANPTIPFTRLYEPKNRSPFMSPNDKTTLVLEYPFFEKPNPQTIVQQAINLLIDKKLIERKEVIATNTYTLNHAYPVLKTNFQADLEPIHDYFLQFKNLHLSGRNAQFQYTHLHDVMLDAKGIVEGFSYCSSSPKL